MFRGTFFHTLDDKGRLAIPRKFRELLPATEGEAKVVVTPSLSDGPGPATLDVYPLSEWKLLEEKIRRLPSFQDRTKALKRRYIHPAQDLVVDSQGRILLPQDFRAAISLSKEAVYTGDLEKFLIWSKDGWHQQKDLDATAAPDLSFDDLDL